MKIVKRLGAEAVYSIFATNNVRFNFATSRENINKAIKKIDKILK